MLAQFSACSPALRQVHLMLPWLCLGLTQLHPGGHLDNLVLLQNSYKTSWCTPVASSVTKLPTRYNAHPLPSNAGRNQQNPSSMGHVGRFFTRILSNFCSTGIAYNGLTIQIYSSKNRTNGMGVHLGAHQC